MYLIPSSLPFGIAIIVTIYCISHIKAYKSKESTFIFNKRVKKQVPDVTNVTEIVSVNVKHLVNITNTISANDIEGSPEDVHFYLYTDQNPTAEFEMIVGDKEKLKKSPFRVNAVVKTLIHGFTSGFKHEYPAELKNAYLNTTKDLNLILVDWSILAEGPLYSRAVLNTDVVGNKTTQLIQFLVSENVMSIENMHVIGHSLGAHVGGIVGYKIHKTLGKMIPRISGLDPAKPLYTTANLEHRLDASDAQFVDVIHSSVLGLYGAMGNVDFYPNQGMTQPECTSVDAACSHSRAHKLFTQSVLDPRKFRACKCSKVMGGIIPIIIPKKCICNETDQSSITFMGESVDKSANGAFYLQTEEGQNTTTKN